MLVYFKHTINYEWKTKTRKITDELSVAYISHDIDIKVFLLFLAIYTVSITYYKYILTVLIESSCIQCFDNFGGMSGGLDSPDDWQKATKQQ